MVAKFLIVIPSAREGLSIFFFKLLTQVDVTELFCIVVVAIIDSSIASQQRAGTLLIGPCNSVLILLVQV